VIEYLVEEEIVSDDNSELTGIGSATLDNTLELKRLELQRERESQLKLKELEIR